MKKLAVIMLVSAMSFSLIGCGGQKKAESAAAEAEATAEAAAEEATETVEEASEAVAEAGEAVEEAAEEVVEEAADAAETTAEATTEAAGDAAEAAADAASDVAVMSHADFMAAEVDSPVCVETYVQATQSWYDGQISVYAQSEDGAYFIYNMACSEEDAAKLTAGQKIKVTGYKAEWSGEIEIVDGTFEFEDGSYTAEPVDVTDLLGKDELIDHQNELVTIKGVVIEPKGDDKAAFLYAWDGSGSEDSDSDLYFDVSKDGETYTFTVEYYLSGPGSEAYEGVRGLNVGDTVDLTGFLYWYEGPQPHITQVSVQ